MNDTPAKVEPPQTLADWATDVLRERITTGALGAGDRLVEARIARELRISRAPVREALTRLGSEGFAREEPRRGWFVRSFAPLDVRELYDLRAALENLAVRLLMQRADAELGVLDNLLDRMERAATQENQELIARLDFEFHESICKLSGSRRLHAVYMSLAAPLHALLRLEEHRSQDPPSRIWREHVALLDMIKARETDGAVEALSAHVDEARDRLLEELRRTAERSHDIGSPPKRTRAR